MQGALVSAALPPPSPVSGLTLPERLTIPSASHLIYHPNGGYKRGKNNNLQREKQRQKGKEKCQECHSRSVRPWFNLHDSVGTEPLVILTVIYSNYLALRMDEKRQIKIPKLHFVFMLQMETQIWVVIQCGVRWTGKMVCA